MGLLIKPDDKCHLFNKRLEDYSLNKIDDFNDGAIVYDKSSVIHAWKRCDECINIFYSFCDN
jgi:hypothetical protein